METGKKLFKRKVLKFYNTVPPEKEEVLTKITDEEVFKLTRKHALATNLYLIGKHLYNAVILTEIVILDLTVVIWKTSWDIVTELPNFNNNYEANTIKIIFHDEFLSISYNNYEVIKRTLIFVVLLSALRSFIIIPINVWEIYVDEKYGFYQQTIGYHFRKWIKTNLSDILTKPLIVTAISAYLQQVEIGRSVWQLLSLFWVGHFGDFYILNGLFCYLTCCCCKKFVPLKEINLKTRLQSLAQRLNFPFKEISVLVKKSSTTTAHLSKAYIHGIRGGKRVLLDTLVQGVNEDINYVNNTLPEESQNLPRFTIDEIEMIVCYEMGHWALNHEWKTFLISQLDLAIKFLLIGLCFYNTNLYHAFGFVGVSEQYQPVVIKLFIIKIYVLGNYCNFSKGMKSWYQRKTEFDADALVVKVNSPDKIEHLNSAVIKLYNSVWVFPFTDRLYEIYCTPNVLSRLENIERHVRDQPAPV